ncbi:MAG: zinc-ribbon domain-containing protein [Coriobacteriia bacterium]|nr:zinc-ribbon domain-containing protein [Coriobacteriia bacterium]
MKICQNCQASIEEEAKFCTACGAPQIAPTIGEEPLSTSAQPANGEPAVVAQDGVGQSAANQATVEQIETGASGTSQPAMLGDEGLGGGHAEGRSVTGQSAVEQPIVGQAAAEQSTSEPWQARSDAAWQQEANPGDPSQAPYAQQAGYACYQQGYQQYSQASVYAAPIDPNDHTAEFDPRDIAENKIYAMLGYLLSVVGIVVTLLACPQSPYARFHVRQAVKLLILETIVGIVTGLLFWTIIVPIVAGIFLLALFVVHCICFFQVCSGTAKDAPIVRSFNFMN